MAGKFNLDGPAFEQPTDGLIRPALILVVSEDAEEAVVNPHPRPQPQPRPVPAPPPQEPPNTQDSLNIESIMAEAPDLKTFQEREGYLYAIPEDSDIVPEDYDDDEEMDGISDDAAGDQGFEL